MTLWQGEIPLDLLFIRSRDVEYRGVGEEIWENFEPPVYVRASEGQNTQGQGQTLSRPRP